jgi:1-acyl-sn-glycerol-3-phosphate acyltransferase
MARGVVIRGVFGTIIDTYACQQIVGDDLLAYVQDPAIFVANHSSHVDTPVLLRSLPPRRRRRTAVAAAVDYFYASRLLANTVSLAFGTVPMERRSRGVDIHPNGHLEPLIDSGWNLVVFAEGTRSRDGRVGIMRSGAAVLAARHGVPIVPVHISGTHDAMPPGCNWMIRPRGEGRRARHPIRVTFGLPIYVGADAEPLEVMETIRLFMAECGADTTPDPRLAALRAARAAKSAEAALATYGQPA